MSINFKNNLKLTKNIYFVLAGIAFIAGGAAFDVYATLHHSPDLEYEANPIARSLLDSGVDTGVVVFFGIFSQLSIVLASIMVWVNFIARIDWYRNKVEGADNLWIVGRAIGSVDNSWSSLLGGRIRHDVFVCSLGFLVIPLFAHRWYLGLEWFGLVPISRIVVPAVMLLVAVISMLVWTRIVSKRCADQV